MEFCEIDDLLLSKEKFYIGTFVTQHNDLNLTHESPDWKQPVS